MGGDAAMNLIMQPDLAVRLVLPAGKLHAVHAQVAALEARRVGVFGVDLRQRDVGPAVVGPRLQLRQLVDRRLAIQHRARSDLSRPRQQGRPGRLQIQPRPPHHVGRIDLERDELLEPLERVAEEVSRPGHRAEQVAEHGEAAADDVGQQQRRPARAKHPPLDFGRFEVGIDRRVDAEQLPGRFQIVDALAEAAVHGHSIECKYCREKADRSSEAVKDTCKGILVESWIWDYPLCLLAYRLGHPEFLLMPICC